MKLPLLVIAFHNTIPFQVVRIRVEAFEVSILDVMLNSVVEARHLDTPTGRFPLKSNQS